MRSAIGYVRVSTDDQAAKGESLTMQTEKIRAMATVQDVELRDVLTDAGESAKSLHRPAMEHLLDLVDAGAIDVVICYKLDRLTRSVRDLGDLLERFEKQGVSLVSLSESLDTSTAAGRLVLNVMASVAQWEREVIAERTREALQSKRRRGERVGTVPYGFQVDEDGRGLLELPEEQKTLATVHQLRESGQSLRAVADELNRRGLTTRRGTSWRHQYVANVLRAA